MNGKVGGNIFDLKNRWFLVKETVWLLGGHDKQTDGK
jgi:hypothetical protein